MRIAQLALLLALASGGACATSRAGWARRGSYWVLTESATVQIRRGPQSIDPATGELVIAWVGARSVEGRPPLLECTLCVFDDSNGDRTPDPGEHRLTRESLERTDKVLFGDVRAPPGTGKRLRGRLVARTGSEEVEVSWTIDPD